MEYKTIVIVPSFEEMNIDEDKKLFEAHKTNGVIIGGDYESDRWVLSDEKRNYGLNFELNDYKFDFIVEEDFVAYLKSFCLYQIGNLVLDSIRAILLEIKKIASNEPENAGIDSFQRTSHVREFFSGISGSDGVIEVLDYYETINIDKSSGQRQLASMHSYLIFNDILDKFWNFASRNQKLFYFPVWMWWKITSVLPTRPIELVLTPRNCLSVKDGEYYLTVRKNRIKGGSKYKTYKIDTDYEKIVYSIPENIGKEIAWYIKETEDFPRGEVDTLFITTPHYEKWERSVPVISRYYTYTNLSTCLVYFYNEIIIDKYGYRVIDDKSITYLKQNEIQYIDLGDSRHIATFNAIFNGTGPVLAQLLAGHDNMEITAHYFSNINKVVRCMAYNEYLKISTKNVDYKISTLNPFTVAAMKEVNGGCCCSKGVSEGNYEDCLEARGPDFEIGYCQNCQYFRTAGQKKDDTSFYESVINEDANLLLEIAKRYRNSPSDVSEINRIHLRFKNDVNKFIQFLIGEQIDASQSNQ